ncbi:MAG: hypothetical protein SGILL_006206 [Bacillariaceae sp.]
MSATPRRSSEIKGFLSGDSSFFFPSQLSFFQDERSNGDAATGVPETAKAPTVNVEYSIEDGLQPPLEMTYQEPRRREFWTKRRTIMSVVGVTLFVIVMALSISLGTKDEAQSTASSAFIVGSDGNSNAGDGGGSGSSSSTNNNSKQGPFFQSELTPLSTMDPVGDLNVYSFDGRSADSLPSKRLEPLNRRAIPTNAWYQSILRLDADSEPTKNHKASLIPYVVDMAGAVPGVRIHGTRLEATASQVTLTIDEPYALVLGAAEDGVAQAGSVLTNGYTVTQATELGITLQWDAYNMKSSLVKGSPYITMVYNDPEANFPSVAQSRQATTVLPTLFLEVGISDIVVDGVTINVDEYCGSEQNLIEVEKELDLSFFVGQRWLVFVSRPLQLTCQSTQGSATILQVVSSGNAQKIDDPLIVRAALVVSNASPTEDESAFETKYVSILRDNHEIFPGDFTNVDHAFDVESGEASQTQISFDWNPRSMYEHNGGAVSAGSEMIMFSMPHHQDLLGESVMRNVCAPSLLGPVCLVRGSTWNVVEELPVVDFQAPRHPRPEYVPVIAEALLEDARYQIPSNFQIGAGDTYFSGKTIARLARILLIAEELEQVCASPSGDYASVCAGLKLPSESDISIALDQLRRVVTVWVKDNQQAPFVYDASYGGIVNCGCLYNNGECSNRLPSCPAAEDQGLNFAVLAHFDETWAKDNFENVLLLVRDYANPSSEDDAFPVFRHKDLYNGHSWASGITNPIFPNIMNQESSSEAIMSYEAVALFGKAMSSIYGRSGDQEKASRAQMMRNVGVTLAATEIRSTQKYWQVVRKVPDLDGIYPEAYQAKAVGILWSTMVQFTTWL